MMDYFRHELEQLECQGLLRRTTAWPQAGGRIELADGRTFLNFSSNDYLGLARDPHVMRRSIESIERWGCGASASRLMCGTLELHEELESALASLVGGESSLVFSSGFGMNVGVMAALAGRDDVIFSDRFIHASLIDGARLSRAAIRPFPHNDVRELERLMRETPCTGRRLIVTESVFSMDGDLAPLEEIHALAARYGAVLLADEAHAIGVWGAGGGICRLLNRSERPDFIAGTLGKALGSLGGFVVCSGECRSFLINRARSFIFATALPPACLGAALGAIERIGQDPGMGERLLDRARAFHGMLASEGLNLPEFRSQIIPLPVGGNEEAMKLAQSLRNQGLLVTAIRPPTVPPGTARLRLSVTLAHGMQDLTWAAGRIVDASREMGLV
jgi:8-amino-7-oxononanoate synthase